jgi:hypothetical protein
MELWVQLDIRRVVPGQTELHFIHSSPLDQREIMMPTVGTHQARIGDAVRVLPSDCVEGEAILERFLGVGTGCRCIGGQSSESSSAEGFAPLGSPQRPSPKSRKGGPPK